MLNQMYDESGQNSFLDDVNDDELLQHLHGAGDKPLPLRKIHRKNYYKRGPLKPAVNKAQLTTRNEHIEGQRGRSLMIDTR